MVQYENIKILDLTQNDGYYVNSGSFPSNTTYYVTSGSWPLQNEEISKDFIRKD
jgi:hypothetical protein